MHQFLAAGFTWVQTHIYLGTFLFMAMESSVLPVPSELVIPPAAYMASSAGGGIVGIIFIGTFGSWFGSAVMYWLSRGLGRVVIVGFGKYVMITEEKIERAEHWLHRYEAGGIFFARLLPVIRHLISIPAGLVQMSFGLFSLMTILGAGAWCSVLAWFGKQFTGSIDDPHQLIQFIKGKSHVVVAVVLVLCVLYFAVVKLTAPKAGESV